MTQASLWGTTTAELEIFGERVRDARLIQRLKAQDVADKSGLPPDRYSRIENSLSTKLDASKARQISAALDFPLPFLASPPMTPVQRGSLLFRAKRSMTRGEEEQLVAWSRLIGDVLLRSVQENVRLPYLKLPRLPDRVSPAEAAVLTRAALGVADDRPIPHLTRTLERAGVYLAAIDYGAELHAKQHDAFSTWVGPSLDWALIVVRTNSSWERTRLSVAHEVGHVVMHHVRRDGDLESEAYAFASELLLPSTSLRDEWPGSATLMSLMPLKRRWGISLAGLIEHGYRAGLLHPDQRINLYKQLSNRRDRATGERWRLQEPGWREREIERPKLIAKVTETAFGPAVNIDQIAAAVYGWRSDLVHELLAGQVTSWSKELTDSHRIKCRADDDGQIAPVIPLR
jgi:Zn-dependent peptidase ImmA (M78 family)